MNDRPVIDLLLEAILNGNMDEVDKIGATRGSECTGVRVLVSTPDEAAIDLDLGLGLKPCEFVSPIFEGPRANMVSVHTAVQGRLAGGRSSVLLDYSIGFDSNFAEKLRALVSNENIQQVDRDRVIAVLKLKAANPRVQFDIQPFLNENTRFAREEANNDRPWNTLVVFRMLDHLDWDAFRNDPSQLKFDAPADQLRERLKPEARDYLASLYAAPQVLKAEATALGTQALLLRFATLWHTSRKPNRLDILRQLVDFGLFEMGALPLSELTLIWSGLDTKQVARFFGPILTPSKDFQNKVSGMAWDLTHLRHLQNVARQTVLGSFFIPYFASLDARWRELLGLNPIRIMLVDDNTGMANFGRARDVEFQILLSDLLKEREKEMTPAKVEARRQAAKYLNSEAMARLADREWQSWTACREA